MLIELHMGLWKIATLVMSIFVVLMAFLRFVVQVDGWRIMARDCKCVKRNFRESTRGRCSFLGFEINILSP